MHLLVDAQLPPQLADWLRTNACQATAVHELGLRDSTDGEIWTFAASRAMVIVTKDDDFAEMAARFRDGPPVLWIRCGNVINRELFRRFEQSWPIVRQLLSDGARLVELR